MTKYKESPVYQLNIFVENALRGIDQLGGTPDLDKQIIPQKESYRTDVDTNNAYEDEEGITTFQVPFITPAQQSPEATSIYDSDQAEFRNLPFGTYTLIMDRSGEPWEICGRVTYVFYSGEVDKLIEIGNFVQDVMGRADWSAYDLNYFFRNDEDNPFDFKKICVDTIFGPMPANDKGGRHALTCVLAFDATYEGPGRDSGWSAGNQLGRGTW